MSATTLSPREMSAADEAAWIHGVNEHPSASALAFGASYFSVFRVLGIGAKGRKRTSQHSFPVHSVRDVVQAACRAPDVYMSQSSFLHQNRLKSSFRQVQCAWVDLDLYNMGMATDGATIHTILEHGRSLGIPVPSLVIHSGRGCYLKWVFTRGVADLPVWESLQAVLTSLYACLASDVKSRDASRVFRMLQSTNSKSGLIVMPIDGSGLEYEFRSFAATIEALRIGELMPALEQRRVSRVNRSVSRMVERLSHGIEKGNSDALTLYGQLREPIMQDQVKTPRSLGWGRFRDLRDLMVMRGGVPVGMRDITLFWMTNFLAQAQVVTTDNWQGEVNQLLGAFPGVGRDFDPLGEQSLSSVVRRMKGQSQLDAEGMKAAHPDKLLYRPTSKFLIDTFGITDQEMVHLSTILDAEEKRRRKMLQLDAKHEGRAQRREERKAWRQQVESIHAKWAAGSGDKPNMSALARQLGVHRVQVSTYWSDLCGREGAVQDIGGVRRDLEQLSQAGRTSDWARSQVEVLSKASVARGQEAIDVAR